VWQIGHAAELLEGLGCDQKEGDRNDRLHNDAGNYGDCEDERKSVLILHGLHVLGSLTN
jgi:hypothetical protein